jgi:hypothetical protein
MWGTRPIVTVVRHYKVLAACPQAQFSHPACTAHLKISMLGSVYGLKAGLKRSLVSPKRVKNSFRTPMRSPRVRP